jgi:hypothetical protein
MIEKTYTLLGVIFRAFWVVIIALFVITALRVDDTELGNFAFDFIIGLFIVLHYGPSLYNRFRLRKRSEHLEQLAARIGAQKRPVASMALSENLLELGRRDSRFSTVIQKDGWQYGDYSYAIYKKAKNGEYKAWTVHYSVVRVELPRELPNLLFDSPRTHSRQFKYLFDKSQVHSLEGNFDKYFTTYFPKYYSIDALSIITPEVMEVMINARDYDIEVSGDGLYLYRPLLSTHDIPQMIEKAMAVREKLMNNLVTYRDERLEMAKGRAATSKFGSRLRRNPYRTLPAVLLGAAALVAGVVVGYRTGQLLNAGVIYGGIVLSFGLVGTYSVLQDNRRLDEQYARLLKTKSQDKPKSQ